MPKPDDMRAEECRAIGLVMFGLTRQRLVEDSEYVRHSFSEVDGLVEDGQFHYETQYAHQGASLLLQGLVLLLNRADAAALTCPINGDGSHNSDTGIRGTVRTPNKMESVFHISNCDVENHVIVCTWLFPLKCSDMVDTPASLIMKKVIEFANDQMDKKVLTIAKRQAEQKRKLEFNDGNNQGYQQQNKRQNTRRAYTARHGEKRGYTRSLPLCTKCNYHHKGLCAPRCNKCKKIGHLARDCRSSGPNGNNNNRGNSGTTQNASTCYECGV
ncbi:reverse transcriptase domain-containing protein [Tanacetum coccineum]